MEKGLFTWYTAYTRNATTLANEERRAVITLHFHTAAAFALSHALPYASLTTEDASEALIDATRTAALRACECLLLHQALFTYMPFDLSVLALYCALLTLKVCRSHLPVKTRVMTR